MISELTTGPKVRGFKPGRLLRAIKFRNTPSIGEKVKPEAPWHKILRHVKISCNYEQKYFSRLNYHLFRPFLLLATDDSAGRTARELWCTNQEFSSVGIIIQITVVHIYIPPWGMNDRPIGGSGPHRLDYDHRPFIYTLFSQWSVAVIFSN
jgi:hypothetical protein